jgi:hypothetical protein
MTDHDEVVDLADRMEAMTEFEIEWGRSPGTSATS